MSFGMVIEGMLAALPPALDSATMPATTAPAPTVESKNERREGSTVCFVDFSAGFAVRSLLTGVPPFVRE